MRSTRAGRWRHPRSRDERIDSLYDLGEIVDQFGVHERIATVYGGWSRGLREWLGAAPHGRLHLRRQRSSSASPASRRRRSSLPAGSQRSSYPWIGYEWVQDGFEKTPQSRPDREDRGLAARPARAHAAGLRVAVVRLGPQRRGVRRRQSRAASSPASGNGCCSRRSVTGRHESGGFADVVGERGGALLLPPVRAAPAVPERARPTSASNLDADQQILLGGDNGLRGYPLRYQAGEGRWLFTAEQRFFTNWYPFRLFNVGGAVFYDMGGAWGANPRRHAVAGLLKDVGFGLRLGNSRSALGNVLHVDVAFPLDGDKSISRLQFWWRPSAASERRRAVVCPPKAERSSVPRPMARGGFVISITRYKITRDSLKPRSTPYLPPSSPMDPIRNLGFLLKDVSRLWVRHFEQRATQLGMTLTHAKVLVFLSRNEGATQARLAELSRHGPDDARARARPHGEGWLARAPPGPERSPRLSPVPEAAADPVLAEINRIGDKARSEALAGLSHERSRATAHLARTHPRRISWSSCRAQRPGEPAQARTTPCVARDRPRAPPTSAQEGDFMNDSTQTPLRNCRPPSKGDRLRRLRVPLMVGGSLVIVRVAAYLYFASGRSESTDDAYVSAARVAISTNVPGRVIELRVHDNQRVKQRRRAVPPRRSPVPARGELRRAPSSATRSCRSNR